MYGTARNGGFNTCVPPPFHLYRIVHAIRYCRPPSRGYRPVPPVHQLIDRDLFSSMPCLSSPRRGVVTCIQSDSVLSPNDVPRVPPPVRSLLSPSLLLSFSPFSPGLRQPPLPPPSASVLMQSKDYRAAVGDCAHCFWHFPPPNPLGLVGPATVTLLTLIPPPLPPNRCRDKPGCRIRDSSSQSVIPFHLIGTLSAPVALEPPSRHASTAICPSLPTFVKCRLSLQENVAHLATALTWTFACRRSFHLPSHNLHFDFAVSPSPKLPPAIEDERDANKVAMKISPANCQHPVVAIIVRRRRRRNGPRIVIFARTVVGGG